VGGGSGTGGWAPCLGARWRAGAPADMSTARLGVRASPPVAVPWRPGIAKTHVGVTLEDPSLIFGRLADTYGGSPVDGASKTVLSNSAAGPPVDASRGTGHELLVDQVPAQRAVVVEDLLEDLVHGGFRVPAAGLERLYHLVEQQAAPSPLGRDRGDPAVADERPHLVWRVDEEAVRVFVHLGKYDAGAADLSSEIPFLLN